MNYDLNNDNYSGIHIIISLIVKMDCLGLSEYLHSKNAFTAKSIVVKMTSTIRESIAGYS